MSSRARRAARGAPKAARARSGREVARRVLRRVESGAYASLALGGELERAEISAADRRLATEITYGALRNDARLDRALGALLRQPLDRLPPPARAALRGAAYQILILDRVPSHAAVNDAVAAVRRDFGAGLGGMANGVLRRLAREGEPRLPDPERDPRGYAEIACSLPGWIAARLEEAVGRGELAEAAAAFCRPAPLYVRANELCAPAREVEKALGQEASSVRPAPACPGAFEVGGLGDPEASSAFARGLFTVQDEAAQLVSHMLAPEPGADILDACAGVGGKATHLCQLAGRAARIDAADASAVKLERLRETAARLGACEGIQSVRVDLAAPGAALRPTYDAILLDAPCSGLGVLRRHPEIKGRAAEGDVAALARAQHELLLSVADRLRPGGALVYSVCTFTAEEGPERVRALLDARSDFAIERPPARDGGPAWSRLLTPEGALETWPHRDGADAFYAVRLRRRREGD